MAKQGDQMDGMTQYARCALLPVVAHPLRCSSESLDYGEVDPLGIGGTVRSMSEVAQAVGP